MNKELNTDQRLENAGSAIDWSSLLSAAADPDLEEFLRTPIDNALIILKDGKEIQKLSVLRTLSDLFESNADDVLEKVLPQAQQMLEEEASNLDLHCEAAVSYKNIYRNTKLSSNVPGLRDVILNYIIQNASRQKDNLTAAAWLETLVDVIEHAPLSALKHQVVPLTIAQAQLNQRAQRRVLATKLIEKLCQVLPTICVRRDLAPCVQSLCQDPNSNVRVSIAQRLGVIAQSLRNTNESGTTLASCLVELCADTQAGTRETALSSVSQCIPYLSKESKKDAVIPMIKKLTEQAIISLDQTLIVIAKNLGEWMYLLKDVLSANDSRWFFDIYGRAANLTGRTSTSCLDTSSANPSSPSAPLCSSTVVSTARRMCAYNFPCIVFTFHEKFNHERLLKIFEDFCSDPDDDVRATIAAGFHEVVKLLPNQFELVPAFIELVRSSSVEVIAHLMGNLDQILPQLYRSVSSHNNPWLTHVHLSRVLVGCNRLLRGSSSWRSHQSYLSKIAVLRQLIGVNDLFLSFVPMLKQEVLTARAIPCRMAASNTLLLFMRENSNQKSRQLIIDFFVNMIAKHQSCHRRRLFLDIIPDVINNFSRSFFHDHFLEVALHMCTDKISNIRLQLCHKLPAIKENLFLPDDEPILQRLETIVRDLLKKEHNPLTRQLIQTYACELSRTETRPRSDNSDQLKYQAEQQLWSKKVNDVPLEPVKNSALNSQLTVSHSESKLDRGYWRIRLQQPRMAVVRPQPQVVVTQRSPSPMPGMEGRRSKLPLACSQISKSTVDDKTSHISRLPPQPRPPPSSSVRNKVDSNGVKSRSTAINRLNSRTNGNNVGARSTTPSIMVQSTPSARNARELSTPQSMSTLRSFGQGLIKVRSFSNIERRPGQFTMRVRTPI